MAHAVRSTRRGEGTREAFDARGGLLCLALLAGVSPSACGRVELGSPAITIPGSAGAGGLGGLGSLGGSGAGLAGAAGASQADAGEDAGAAADAAGQPRGGDSPSCRSVAERCGPNEDSCCVAPVVAGGAVSLPFDIAGEVRVDANLPSFRLDKYEVTIGRFRRFIDGYDAWRALGNPLPGAGEHPRAAGSGWLAEFDAALPQTGAELELRVRECEAAQLATLDVPDGAGQLPLNCVSWFEALAFCAWDEARLPTYAEWYYAAAAGELDRLYPWGDAPAPTREHALYGCSPEASADACSVAYVLPVGSFPSGQGLYGQNDLAGSMTEWLLDGSLTSLTEGCTDCVAVSDGAARFWRGGSWLDGEANQANTYFAVLPPSLRLPFVGLRCARDEP